MSNSPSLIGNRAKIYRQVVCFQNPNTTRMNKALVPVRDIKGEKQGLTSYISSFKFLKKYFKLPFPESIPFLPLVSQPLTHCISVQYLPVPACPHTPLSQTSLFLRAESPQYLCIFQALNTFVFSIVSNM